MMVTPSYAARTKMLKNSGWIVEDLPEAKQIISQGIYDNAPKIIAEIKEVLNPISDLEKELTEKEIDLNLGDQSEEIDLLEIKVVSEVTNPRVRQKGSKNK